MNTFRNPLYSSMARTKSIPKPSSSSRANKTKDLVAASTKKHKKERVTREIIRCQQSTKNLIPLLPFSRLVRDILADIVGELIHFHGASSYRVTKGFLECLQAASEEYMTSFFADLNFLARHAKRVTVMCRDIAMLKQLKNQAYPDE